LISKIDAFVFNINRIGIAVTCASGQEAYSQIKNLINHFFH